MHRRDIRELDDDAGFVATSERDQDSHTDADPGAVGLRHAVRQQVLAGDCRNERHGSERAWACVTRERL
jgi:hypothetical protein